jgi:FkbM family methyltransferase
VPISRRLHAVAHRLGGRRRLVAGLFAAIRLVPVRSLRSRLFRSVSWRLSDQLSAPVEVTTPGGRMILDAGDSVGRVLTIAGEWEPHVTRAFRASLERGDVCLDVGAHVGYYTLLAAKLVGPPGHVYAFEASPTTYRSLEANLARNRVANVTPANVAAGAEEGSAVLYEAPSYGSGASSLSPRMLESPDIGRFEEYTPVQVRVGSIASLVPREEFHRVRLIKIDVEGYEVEVLRGLEEILAIGAPLALIVELSPEWSTEPPAPFVEDLCRRHALTRFQLSNEYTFDGYFPARIKPPELIDAIPAGRCDLLLRRERATA